jgi:hypothetical protein
MLGRIYNELDLIKIAVNASKIRPEYHEGYKMGAITGIGEAMNAITRASSNLEYFER